MQGCQMRKYAFKGKNSKTDEEKKFLCLQLQLENDDSRTISYSYLNYGELSLATEL
jgi:hypothetical protein